MISRIPKYDESTPLWTDEEVSVWKKGWTTGPVPPEAVKWLHTVELPRKAAAQKEVDKQEIASLRATIAYFRYPDDVPKWTDEEYDAWCETFDVRWPQIPEVRRYHHEVTVPRMLSEAERKYRERYSEEPDF